MKTNPIPPQYARWGRFDELHDRNEIILRDILEDSAKHEDRSAIDQKIGAFYKSCMDERAIERAGTKPVNPEIERINKITDSSEIAREVARLQAQRVSAFFAFGSAPDPDNARMTTPVADEGGLGLPDRDFYFRTDAKSDETRREYVKHIAEIFQLLGDDGDVAGVKARAVMTIETNLASGALSRVERRDPTRRHNPMSLSQFEASVPAFDFNQYLSELKTPAFTNLNVAEPKFFSNLNGVLQSTGLTDLKTYL
ncbi:MAG: M13 family peptidase, partial [Acidobacteriaceae bacterium]|nr:M13 family peptidase [Acidobacteriaceae bacterium]